MTVKEAAVKLELHPSTVYDLITAGQLPCRRVGPKRGKIVLDPADVDEYWRKARTAGGPVPKHRAAPQEYKHFKLPA